MPADNPAACSPSHDCGDLAIACTETADAISGAAAGVARQIDMLAQVGLVVDGIETRQAARASGEAHALADTAAHTLDRSTALVDDSIGELAMLTDLVARMETEVTQFAAAMAQVRHAADSIGAITRTTRMLALNAAIEAERTGASGAPCAVVAAELKKLAQDTGVAATQITTTIESLGREAEAIVRDIAHGVHRAGVARRSFDLIRGAVADVRGYVGQVHGQNRGVVKAMLTAADGQVALIEGSPMRFSTPSSSPATPPTTGASSTWPRPAHARCRRSSRARSPREGSRSRTFSTATIASSPGPIRSAMTPLRRLRRRPDPAATRPDRGARPRITAVVCSDLTGCLPTHMSRYSAAPRDGDRAWNDGHCRTRRRVLDEPTNRAIASSAPVMMAVFRFDRGGRQDFLRNA